MNSEGDAAQMILNVGIQSVQYAFRLVGKGAQALLSILMAALTKARENSKLMGEVSLATLIKPDKNSQQQSIVPYYISADKLEEFDKYSKLYGFTYHSENDPEAGSEKKCILIRECDALRVTPVIEKLGGVRLDAKAEAVNEEPEQEKVRHTQEKTEVNDEKDTNDTKNKEKETNNTMGTVAGTAAAGAVVAGAGTIVAGVTATSKNKGEDLSNTTAETSLSFNSVNNQITQPSQKTLEAEQAILLKNKTVTSQELNIATPIYLSDTGLKANEKYGEDNPTGRISAIIDLKEFPDVYKALTRRHEELGKNDQVCTSKLDGYNLELDYASANELIRRLDDGELGNSAFKKTINCEIKLSYGTDKEKISIQSGRFKMQFGKEQIEVGTGIGGITSYIRAKCSEIINNKKDPLSRAKRNEKIGASEILNKIVPMLEYNSFTTKEQRSQLDKVIKDADTYMLERFKNDSKTIRYELNDTSYLPAFESYAKQNHISYQIEYNDKKPVIYINNTDQSKNNNYVYQERTSKIPEKDSKIESTNNEQKTYYFGDRNAPRLSLEERKSELKSKEKINDNKISTKNNMGKGKKSNEISL